MKHERSNIVDGLAAGATVLMGEVDECTPVVIAREIPRLKFIDGDTSNHLLASFEEDTFRVLYEHFLDKKIKFQNIPDFQLSQGCFNFR